MIKVKIKDSFYTGLGLLVLALMAILARPEFHTIVATDARIDWMIGPFDVAIGIVLGTSLLFFARGLASLPQVRGSVSDECGKRTTHEHQQQ